MQKVKSFADIERHLKVGCVLRLVDGVGRECDVFPFYVHDVDEVYYFCTPWWWPSKTNRHEAPSSIKSFKFLSEESPVYLKGVKHPPREERFKVGEEVQIVNGQREPVIIHEVLGPLFGCCYKISIKNKYGAYVKMDFLYSHKDLHYPIEHKEEKEQEVTTDQEAAELAEKLLNYINKKL